MVWYDVNTIRTPEPVTIPFEVEENERFTQGDKVLVFGSHPGTYLCKLANHYAFIACEYPDGRVIEQSISDGSYRHA